jgi:hypothetical protein
LKQKLHAIEVKKDKEREHEVELLRKDIIYLLIEKFQFCGIMTSRGILEYALSYANKEFSPLNLRTKFDGLETIGKIGKLVEDNNPPTNPDTLKLYNIFKHCGITTGNEARKLYSDVRQQIHCSPWSELSICVVKDRLTPEQYCVISRIAADIFNLNVVITNSSSISR